jgi:hypothetical protein
MNLGLVLLNTDFYSSVNIGFDIELESIAMLYNTSNNKTLVKKYV